MSAAADPFEELRDLGARLLADQHAREPGPAAALLHEDAKVEQGDTLARMREVLAVLDPPQPPPSKLISPDLWRAVEYLRRADAKDDGERREAVSLLSAALNPPPPAPPPPVAVRRVTGDPPAPVLSIPRPDGRRDGAVLSVGTVGLLAGAGGAAKTTLALQVALAAAATPDGADREACGGALIVAGGPVVVATYEDAPPVIRDRVLRMVEHGANLSDGLDHGLDHLHLLDLSGWPLYGPPAGFGYSAPPTAADGWAPLWAAVEATGARLVVIDPALAAFTGESNAAGPVRSFIGALAGEAAKRRAAVLLIAHSSKAARAPDARPYDPGQIGGSSHWTDGARGALSLSRTADAPDRHRLAIVKANYGPSLVSVTMTATRTPGGALVGLDARDGATWQHGTPKEPKGGKGGPAQTGSDDEALPDGLPRYD